MTCRYCGSRNGEGEHRCRRCGRTPDDTLTGEFTLPRTDGALAAKLQFAAHSDPPQPSVSGGRPGRTPDELARPTQGSLFRERSASNVIPFDSFTAAPPKPDAKAASGSKPASKPPARRAPRVREGQGKLDLLPAIPAKPRTLATTVEAVICCEAKPPVPVHRALAGAIDWAMVLIGYGLFLAVVWLWPGSGAFVLTKPNLLFFSGMLLLLGFTYGLFFAIAGTETTGMRCTHLQVLTFDGFPPDRGQRLHRFAGSCLSLCTLLGLLWCLADEEGLTWTDHISRTFPTPREWDARVFRRR